MARKSLIYSEKQAEGLLGFKSRIAEILAIMSTAVLFTHWALVLWFVIPRYDTLDFLRLHYTARLGVDWVGDWRYMFVFPVFGLAVLVVNALVARSLSGHKQVAGAFVYGMTLLLQLLFAVGGVSAILLNG